MKSKKKNRASTIFLVAVMIVGIGLMLYPTVSDYWNSLHQSRAIATYVKTVNNTDYETIERIWTEAEEYNRNLAETGIRYVLPPETKEEYNTQLRTADTDVMAYVEIPKIKCMLPVYHGTDEAVLQVAAGHLEWSSLPVGGESSHCVISGHRGLPSAKLFTNLDEMAEGDIFMLHVLDKTLTYQVDQIRTVLPEELQDLTIEQGRDLCTLITCTPYGVNTHRLLVRGTRIENLDDSGVVISEATPVDPMLVTFGAVLLILLVILIWLIVNLIREKRKYKKAGGDTKL
ncbi:MAG: class C sortase [Firmicutes bacterium]|nr:class C sortase [Bacillota bacterium]